MRVGGIKTGNGSIFSKISSIGYLPMWLVLIIDMMICLTVYFISYELVARYYYDVYYSDIRFRFDKVAIVMGVQLFFFWLFRTYSGIIRYSTFIDMMKLFYAVLSTQIVLFIIHFLMESIGYTGFLRLNLLLYGILSLLSLFVFRLGVKTFYDVLVAAEKNVVPVVVYGTKSAGVGLAQMIRGSNDTKYKVVGFVDDKHNEDKRILGLPILSTDDKNKLIERLRNKRVKAVVVSPIKIKEIDMTHDLDVFINNGMQILVMPEIDKYKEEDGCASLSNVDRNLINLQIEDLLNRKPIEIDKTPVRQMLEGRVVMVTGAAGSIGSEIVRQVSALKPRRVLLFDNAETPLHNIKLEVKERWPEMEYVFIIADVRMRDRVERVMAEYRPDFIFHAAAYKHVPIMEDNPSECVIANVVGTRNVADMAVKYGVKSFVMVSTDKAVNPTNVMGCSKRLAEIYVQSYFKKLVKYNSTVTNFITTRFGNVLGSNGSVIPLFRQQIASGGPVTVTHPDIIRYFMTIPEACQLVLEAGTIGDGGKIYIFDMGMPVKIADLAKKMIRLAGLEPGRDIRIIYTGLRPGEKLYEELLNSEEHVKSEVNNQIMVADTREYDYDEILPMYEKMIAFAYANKEFMVVKTMKEIVPEYKSQNSVYQSVDYEMGGGRA